MRKPICFFKATITGSEVLKKNDTESVTIPTLSESVYLPQGSVIHIHITGTASVQVLANSYSDTSKALVLATTTTSEQFIVDASANYSINVVSVTGIVFAKAVVNQEIDE